MVKKILIYVLMLISLFSLAYSVTNISTCQEINVSGEYVLNQSIIDSNATICIDIKTDNVIFDCQGNIIDGVSYTPTTYSINVLNNSNITISNCILKDWFRSILLENTSNNNLINITSYDNHDGIFLINSSNNNFKNLNIYNNLIFGIYFNGDSSFNIINDSKVFNHSFSDFIYYSNSNLICTNQYNNVTDMTNKNHYFFNYTINMDSWTNISSITLCNANNSNIENINSENNNKGIFSTILFSDNITFSNISISNYYTGFLFKEVNNIFIYNTNTSFNAQYGFDLENSENLLFDNVSSYNNQVLGGRFVNINNTNFFNSNFFNNQNDGLIFENSNNNLFYNINVENNVNYGIALAYSNFNTFNESIFNNNTNGIYLYYSDNNTLENITSNENSNNGIYLENSNYNIINNSNFNNNGEMGVSLQFSDNNVLTEINSNNNSYGIEMRYSSNNNLSEIEITTSIDSGIYVMDGSNNIFLDFIIYDNDDSGFILTDTLNNSLNNFIVYNNSKDIEIRASNSNFCDNNLNNISNNLGKYHFYFNSTININNWNNISSLILCDADNSTIFNLNASNNGKGIFLQSTQSENNNFENLSIISYDFGIDLNSENNFFNNIEIYNLSNTGFNIDGNNNTINRLNINNINYTALNIWGYNNTINNSQIYNNSLYGFISYYGKNKLVNSKIFNNQENIRTSADACDDYLGNVTNNENNYYLYYNESININNWNNISSLILCGAHNSEVKNLISNNNDFNQFIVLYKVNGTIIENITINGSKSSGIYLWNTYNTTIKNSKFIDADYCIGKNPYCFSLKNTLYLGRSTNNNISENYFSENINNIQLDESNSNIIQNNNFIDGKIVFSYWSNSSNDNIFTNNSFNNIYLQSSNWGNTYTIFNSSLLGQNLGNHWLDFNTCLESELRGTKYVCTNPNNYTIDSENNIVDYAPLTDYLVKTAIPQITISVPVDSSFINITRRSVSFVANFSENIVSLTCINQDNKTIDLTNELTINNDISTILPINYGQNILTFNFTDRTGQSNTKIIYLNTTFTIPNSTIDDIDGDGLNNSDDKVFGNTSHIYTNINDFKLKINNSENLSNIFNQTINVTFYRNETKLVEFQNDFSNKTLNLTSLIVKDDRVENSSKLLISGLEKSTQTKTVYLELLGNTTKYSSLCIKDAEIIDFADISSSCNGLNETYISTIPSTVGQYIISYTNSSNTTVKIEGLTHSGIEQSCTESWTYSSWGSCSSSSQSRTATDSNSCGTTNTRLPLTQSCTSSSSGGGGGGGSSSSSTTTTNTPVVTTTTQVTNINSNIVKPQETFTNSYEVSIDSSINLNQKFTGTKIIKIKDKNSNIDLVEFSFDFTNKNLDLSNAIIETGNNGKSYTIVKGINLEQTTKKVKVKIVTNSNAICIKDAEVSSINEVTTNCNGQDEHKFTCDSNNYDGYSCYKENGFYIISGLKHSAVFESEPIVNTPVEIIPQNNVVVPIEENNKLNDEETTTEIIETKENNNIFYYILGGITLILILIGLVIKFSRRKSNSNLNNNSFSSNDTIYNNAKNYIEMYKKEYSKEQLIQGLKNAGYSEEIINKVISEEY